MAGLTGMVPAVLPRLTDTEMEFFKREGYLVKVCTRINV